MLKHQFNITIKRWKETYLHGCGITKRLNLNMSFNKWNLPEFLRAFLKLFPHPKTPVGVRDTRIAASIFSVLFKDFDWWFTRYPALWLIQDSDKSYVVGDVNVCGRCICKQCWLRSSLRCVLRSVRTLCDHSAGRGSELSFCKGEELVVLGGVDQDWIRCRQGDKEGMVPIGYTSLIMWPQCHYCCTPSIRKKNQEKKIF